jgi:hypothetical protein
MSDHEINDQQMGQDVSQWLERMLTGAGEDRKRAAMELSRLGVRTRGSIRPRGTLDMSPNNRLPDPEKIADALQCLEDGDQAVRSQVALALSEWGGEETAAAIRRILESDPNESVQLYCITALRTIGGPTSAEGLRKAAVNGTEAVRDAAISAVEDLATGGRVDCTEGPDRTQQSKSSAGHTRGDIRTRGAAHTRGTGQADLVNHIADTLQTISNEQGASDYLRLRAEEVLRYFRD